MIVIPAIDLLDGKCVRLRQGDYNQVTVFSENPAEFALKWEEAGAERLHVVDLDGARDGKPGNLTAIEKIRKSTSMKIEVGGGIRTIETIQAYVDLGIHWAILGTIAIENRELTEEAVEKFGDKIIIGIDAKGGKVATRGWLTESSTLATDLAKDLSALGIGGIIYTDIARDGMMTGPNIPSLIEVTEVSSCPVIASGGISKMEDLINLNNLELSNLLGAITGRALYDGTLDLSKAIQSLK